MIQLKVLSFLFMAVAFATVESVPYSLESECSDICDDGYIQFCRFSDEEKKFKTKCGGERQEDDILNGIARGESMCGSCPKVDSFFAAAPSFPQSKLQTYLSENCMESTNGCDKKTKPYLVTYETIKLQKIRKRCLTKNEAEKRILKYKGTCDRKAKANAKAKAFPCSNQSKDCKGKTNSSGKETPYRVSYKEEIRCVTAGKSKALQNKPYFTCIDDEATL